MKKYLAILIAGLLTTLQVSAMTPKSSQAALNATQENESTVAPSEEEASTANTTTPIPPVANDQQSEESLDRATGKRGAIERRMTEKDISTKRKASSVSGTITPRY